MTQAVCILGVTGSIGKSTLKVLEQHPDDYMYERAQRFGCSKSGIEAALKRLGISQKKDLRASKSLPIKES